MMIEKGVEGTHHSRSGTIVIRCGGGRDTQSDTRNNNEESSCCS